MSERSETQSAGVSDQAVPLTQVTEELAQEMARCADLLLEAQDCISDLVPHIRGGDAISGLQRIDLATQSVTSLGHILSAMASALEKGHMMSRKQVSGGPILEDIARRVWPSDHVEPSSDNSAPDPPGAIDWF